MAKRKTPWEMRTETDAMVERSLRKTITTFARKPDMRLERMVAFDAQQYQALLLSIRGELQKYVHNRLQDAFMQRVSHALVDGRYAAPVAADILELPLDAFFHRLKRDTAKASHAVAYDESLERWLFTLPLTLERLRVAVWYELLMALGKTQRAGESLP